jgi:hypothetical protein
MTREQFLKKYPLPWTFQQTDIDGGGVILAANDQLMARLCGDIDWAEQDNIENSDNPTVADLKHYHIINGDDDEQSERIALLEFIFDKINASEPIT